MRRRPTGRCARLEIASWPLCSLRAGRGQLRRFDHAYRAVGSHKGLVGCAPDVGLGHLVNPLDLAKDLAPVPEARLSGAQLQGQALVAGQPADQIRLGPRLDALEFLVGDVFVLDSFQLRMKGLTDFLGRMPRRWHRPKHEQVGILVSGKLVEAARKYGNLLVTDQRAIEA